MKSEENKKKTPRKMMQKFGFLNISVIVLLIVFVLYMQISTCRAIHYKNSNWPWNNTINNMINELMNTLEFDAFIDYVETTKFGTLDVIILDKSG